ncbi:hypothetical protein IAQ61_000385 [Plenodomus lingam]|uniref:uncharacterized protein n=1 Tax=Leptosphaeria maculans TaxID=5022 RepID=UPI003319BEFF|nr:hypothetical protein IAQ61_000385 [Plenodomus lingam]
MLKITPPPTRSHDDETPNPHTSLHPAHSDPAHQSRRKTQPIHFALRIPPFPNSPRIPPHPPSLGMHPIVSHTFVSNPRTYRNV